VPAHARARRWHAADQRPSAPYAARPRSPEAVLALDFGDGGTPYTLALDVPASQLRAALDAGAGGFDIEYGEGAQAGVYGRH
jgi:hypothetical protein